jgi:cell division protein FtsB
MNADEIRRALFPHEETIKRLQEENTQLKARIAELESAKPAEQPKEKKRGGDTRKES